MFLFLELSGGTHNTLSSMILRDSRAYASNFHWKGWRKVKQSLLRLKSSPAKLQSFHQKQETDGWAQLQEELQLLWKNYPGMCCKQGRQDSAAVLHRALLRASGWMVPQLLQLREMPFQGGTCLAFLPALFACLCPGLAHCNSRRKVHQRLIYVSKSYISGVCCRPCPGELTLTTFLAAPPCSVSLLNSPFRSGQLHDKEFLYLGRLTEATRETSGILWSGVSNVLRETEKKRGSSTVSLVCAQPLTQSQSDSQSLLL